MVGVTSIEISESVDELATRLRQADTPKEKERLQVLYWLKQENAPSINAIAQGMENIEIPSLPGYRCTAKVESSQC